MSESFICRTLRKEDEEAVKRLVKSAFYALSMDTFWDWKYLQNPGFDRSLVAVAENNGKIIGCNHWLPRKLKLSDSIAVDSMMGANIAVAPEFRRKGVGRALIYFLRSQNEKRKPLLMYMYADSELSKHFHTPVGGYVLAPSDTVLYMRILNWNRVKKSATAFNEKVKRGRFKSQLAKVDLTVAVKVHGAPTLCLHLDSKGVETDFSDKSVDVMISSDLATLSKIKDGHGASRLLIRPFLTGRLRFKGRIWKILALYRSRWVFREILREDIS